MTSEVEDREYIITLKMINELYGVLILNRLQYTANEMYDTFTSRPHLLTQDAVYRCCEFYQAPTLEEPKSSCKLVNEAGQDAAERVLDELELRMDSLENESYINIKSVFDTFRQKKDR